MRDSDDDVVEAEILEGPLPARVEPMGLVPVGAPAGDAWVLLSLRERQVAREALAWYHDHGPRIRSTRLALQALEAIGAADSQGLCCQCDNTGKWRSGRGMSFCSCPRGVERRANEA